MDQEHKRARRPGASLPPTTLDARATGRQTLVERDANAVRSHAAQGIRGGTGGALPHLDAIQRSFGAHDVSSVRAHDDGDAAAATDAIGAQAYAAGEHVAFGRDPDLHLAAEEAAHVVQQRAGIRLPGGVGAPDDEYEDHAHAVADAVVAGESAEPILDLMTQRGAAKGDLDPAEPRAIHAQMRPAGGRPAPAKTDPWTLMFKGAASNRVHRAGRVQAENGVRLRKSPSPGGATIVIVPFNTEAMVERETTEAHEHDRWAYVVTKDGAGFCERQYVTTDMPECSAKLHLVTKGETLGGIAERAYGKFIEGGNDARLYVHALYLANKHRTGIRLDDVDLSAMDTMLRGKDEEETLRIYKGVKVIEGQAIWLPSNDFIQQLKAKHFVTSGSTELSKAWREAKEVVADAIDDVKYAAGLVVGLVEGAAESIIDMFKGAAQMAEAVTKIVLKLVTGDVGGLVGMAKHWIGGLAQIWKDKDKIHDGFVARWNDDDAWSRGKFRGEVIGWVAMTVLLCVITAGEVSAGVVAILASKFPTLIKGIQAVGKIGDVSTYAHGVAKGGHAISEAAEDIIKKRIHAAEEAARKKKHKKHDKHGDHDDDHDNHPAPGSVEALKILKKIRRSTKIAKLELAKTGYTNEDFELAKATYQFVNTANQRAHGENLDAYVLQQDDSPGSCRQVVIMPHAMHALAADARRHNATAIDQFAQGKRDKVRVKGEVDGKTFQVNLQVVFNGPH